MTSVPNQDDPNFQELVYLIENIEGYFRNQLKTHEVDFMNAYKEQMKKVKKELNYLKQKRNEANGALMNDTRITTLQKQIAEFKENAMMLDGILEKKKREVSKQNNDQREKTHTIQFLSKSLKESMK